jgi:hypothetical protein
MIVLSVLGLLVWLGGLCALAVQGIRWSGNARGDGSRSLEARRTLPNSEIPDTVPPEWIKDYGTAQNRRRQAGRRESPREL